MRILTFFGLLLSLQIAVAQHIDGTFISKFDRLNNRSNPQYPARDSVYETAWRGERVYFQVLIWGEIALGDMVYRFSDLTGDSTNISSDNASIRFPAYVKGDPEARSCGEYPSRSGSYLITDALKEEAITSLNSGDSLPVLIMLDIPPGIAPGVYDGKFTVTSDAGNKDLSISIDVLPHTLPAISDWTFHLDIWQFPAAGLQHYNDHNPTSKIELWSDEHFQFIRPAYEILANAGQKVITAHIKQGALGSPSMVRWIRESETEWTYDFSVFDKYVSEMMILGISKQISCFSPVGWNESEIPFWDETTQSYQVLDAPIGSEAFNERWDHFLTVFKDHLEEKGWFDKSVLYLDEVAETKLGSVVDVVKNNDPNWKLGIAYSHGLSNESKSHFYDLSGILEDASNEGILDEKVSTFYTSCTQLFPNNYVTIENSPAEMTWMPYYSASNNFDGYLRWAFDNWKNSNALDIRDGSNTAGDFAFIYRDGNSLPMQYFSSLRLEMLREGIEDFEKIRILRNLYSGSSNPDELEILSEIDIMLQSFDISSGVDSESVIPEAQATLAYLSAGEDRDCEINDLAIQTNGAKSDGRYDLTLVPQDRYHSLENHQLTVEPGMSVTFDIGNDQSNWHVSKMWVDFDFNRKFEDNEIIVGGGSNQINGSRQITVHFPDSLKNGKGFIRLVIRVSKSEDMPQCQTSSYESVIDIPYLAEKPQEVLSSNISNEIIIYPNPSKNEVIVRGLRGTYVSLNMMSMTGEIVKTGKNSFHSDDYLIVDTSHLKPGCYLLEFASDDHRYLGKLIVQ